MPDHEFDPADDQEASNQLTPEQDARVRRLLADARVTEPLPREVGQRLDGVLADLTRQRSLGASASEPGGPPAPSQSGEEAHSGDAATPAPARVLPFRRRAAQVLLAAAAVAAIGFGATQVLPGDGGSDDAGGSSADNQVVEENSMVERNSEPPAASSAEPSPQDEGDDSDSGGTLQDPPAALPPTLGSDTSGDDLAALLDQGVASAPTTPPGCAGVPGKDGDRYTLTERDSEPVVVRFRPTSEEGIWKALAFPCGTESAEAPERPGRTFQER